MTVSAIVCGVIGGLVSVLLTTYVAKKVGRSAAPGELVYGPFLWLLGFACLVFALLPIIASLFFGHEKELFAKAILVLCFALGAGYAFGEAALVRGRFDEERIMFSTPWTGTKNELWKDLVSIKLNGSCSWYVLTFRGGANIRLSSYLNGHLLALDMAEKSGIRP